MCASGSVPSPTRDATNSSVEVIRPSEPDEMAVPRVKVSTCFFVCIVGFLVVTKSCSAGCGIDGDGQCSARTKREVSDGKRPKIPLHLAQQLNEADSFEEILELINPSNAGPPAVQEVISRKSASPLSRVQSALSSIFGTRIGGQDDVIIEARGANVKSKSAKPAKCQPMLVPVSVPQPSEPNVQYLPECVFLEQCSGCCYSDLYQCEPTRTEKVVVQVGIYRYGPQGHDQRTGETGVVMEKHTKCKCDCKVKPQHCNEFQRHESCECVCTNNDNRTKCLQNPKKIWDKNRCACSCNEIEDCTTGLEFSYTTCSCVAGQQPVSTRIGSISGDGRYQTRTEEKRIRRWGNSTRYTIVPST